MSCHQRRAEMRKPRFRCNALPRRIVLDRTKIPLAIHELFAHRPRLRHVNERWINHRFAVRVIVAGSLTAIFAHGEAVIYPTARSHAPAVGDARKARGWQGEFWFDRGRSAAAMRYTEARLRISARR